VREEYALYSSLQELIDHLKKQGVEDFDRVDFESWDDLAFVVYDRPETDAEMNKRIEREKKYWEAEKKKKAEEKAAKDRRERSEYERLKRKFESK
jgi:hypothetical protein